MPSDSPGLTETQPGVDTGERLSARLLQTGPDIRFVLGGQGVAGSNPAVPTRTCWSEGFRIVIRSPFNESARQLPKANP
jgi:hypothetical protein